MMYSSVLALLIVRFCLASCSGIVFFYIADGVQAIHPQILDGIKEKSIHLSTYFIICVPYYYLTTHSICQLINVTCIFEVMASNHPINEGKTGDIVIYLEVMFITPSLPGLTYLRLMHA